MSEATVDETPAEAKPGIVAEIKRFWDGLPQKSAFLLLTVCWLALFHFFGNSTFGYVDTGSLFHWMFNAYSAPDSEDGHGNLIPFVVLALVFWKRDVLLGGRFEPWRMAFGLVVLAAGLHVIGFVAQQPRISIIGLFLGFYGIMGLCWGRNWMANIFFPYFLFIFCVPIGSLATVITFPLRLLVSEMAVTVATALLGLDIIREGTLIFDGDRSFQYDVAPACSGIRSLITLFALTTIYGFVTYRTMWRRIVMMLASMPLAVLGNTARITTAIAVGDVYGMDAGLKIEQKLGFVTFLIAIIGIFVLEHFIREPQTSKEAESDAK